MIFVFVTGTKYLGEVLKYNLVCVCVSVVFAFVLVACYEKVMEWELNAEFWVYQKTKTKKNLPFLYFHSTPPSPPILSTLIFPPPPPKKIISYLLKKNLFFIFTAVPNTVFLWNADNNNYNNPFACQSAFSIYNIKFSESDFFFSLLVIKCQAIPTTTTTTTTTVVILMIINNNNENPCPYYYFFLELRTLYTSYFYM